MAREMANPTSALDELVEKNIRPFRNEFLIPTLRELTGDKLSRRNPDFKICKAEIAEIAEHITRFSLAGIAELTRPARRS